MFRQVTNTYGSRLVSKLLKLLIAQLTIIIAVVTVIYSFDVVAGYSALLGGIVFLIPNFYFALHAFRHSDESMSATFLRNFYKGEVGKFLLSLVSFSLMFTLISPINGSVLFLSYLALTLVQWVLLMKLGS